MFNIDTFINTIHWPLTNNKCVLSIASKNREEYKTQTDSCAVKSMTWLTDYVKLLGERKNNEV